MAPDGQDQYDVDAFLLQPYDSPLGGYPLRAQILGGNERRSGLYARAWRWKLTRSRKEDGRCPILHLPEDDIALDYVGIAVATEPPSDSQHSQPGQYRDGSGYAENAGRL